MLELPLFPLDLVLLPYESLPLHIFEPRYKKMVKNAIEQDTPFGIILKQGDEVFRKGCQVEVSKVFKEYKNGEYDILVNENPEFKFLEQRKMGTQSLGMLNILI